MALIETIKLAFENKCDKTKKILNMEDQIKSWEKQMRGVCEQVVHVVLGTKQRSEDTEELISGRYLVS